VQTTIGTARSSMALAIRQLTANITASVPMKMIRVRRTAIDTSEKSACNRSLSDSTRASNRPGGLWSK
jgi:hypothetical protein